MLGLVFSLGLLFKCATIIAAYVHILRYRMASGVEGATFFWF